MSETVTDPKQNPAPAPRSRWGTVAWLISCALVVVFVAGAWFRLRDETGGDQLRAQLTSGARPVAPALPTTAIADDGAPGLEALVQGRPRIVNFWASWCAPCIEEAPVLRDVAADYRGRVDFVGVDAGNEDTLSDARAFVRTHDITFTIVRGDRADKRAWGVGGYPETFLVGADGKISWHTDGPIDAEQLHDVIDRELERDRS